MKLTAMLPVMLLLGLQRQAHAQSEEASAFAGSPACECIADPSAASPISPAASAAGDPAGGASSLSPQCRNATLGFNHVGGLQGIELCSPLQHGWGQCTPWDANVPGECVDPGGGEFESGQPDWCSATWCYVNASTCERSHQPSDLVYHDDDAPSGLSYSYETCGNLDTYLLRVKRRTAVCTRSTNLSICPCFWVDLCHIYSPE